MEKYYNYINMNKIIDFLKSLLQLSTILVGIFGLFLFIGGGWLYHDLQYRYVVDSRYNTIFDKAYSVYLINKGISMDIINDKIYAMNDDVYIIINQESNTIIVYYLNLEDIETINNFTRLQQQYYGDKMILQPIESLGPSETLDIYNGVEKESLDQFIEMIENTALIRLPEGFETEYPELHEALEVLKAGDYTALDYDGYRKLTDVLDRSAAFLNSVVTEYMLIIELVNDLYVMMLALDSKEGVSESCKKAITVIEKAVADDGEHLEDVYALLDDIVGEQEQAGEHKVMLESAVYDISTGYTDDIAANELQDTYRDLEIMDKLLSGSMFVDIDNIAVMGVLNVDTDYIAACKEKLTNEFADLFAANSMTVNRAIMAKILSNIPVFFNTTDEIREYVNGSLSRCREKSELLADYIVIKQMMEE